MHHFHEPGAVAGPVPGQALVQIFGVAKVVLGVSDFALEMN
jgi:hypothetical protein